MKKHFSTLLLLAALGVSAWATVETFLLWEATQQVASSQVSEMHASAKYAAARARHAGNIATVDDSARGGSAPQR
ncbi:MAG: hypothetical protein RJA22_1960 [Verrucomicrobiota bacterium]|jgi:hypothetical protein